MLRSIRYGEADRIVHLYSATRGRIGAIAKGSRRPKSRFGGRLEPFFRLNLVLYEGRGDLFTVTRRLDRRRLTARCGRTGRRWAAAARACDAVLRLLDSGEPNEAAYNLLCTYLGAAGRRPGGGERAGAALAFRLKLALAAGFSPELASCASCGEAEHLAASRAPRAAWSARAARGRLPAERGDAPVHGRGAGGPLAEAPEAERGAGAGRPGDHRDARAPRARASARGRGLVASGGTCARRPGA